MSKKFFSNIKLLILSLLSNIAKERKSEEKEENKSILYKNTKLSKKIKFAYKIKCNYNNEKIAKSIN